MSEPGDSQVGPESRPNAERAIYGIEPPSPNPAQKAPTPKARIDAPSLAADIDDSVDLELPPVKPGAAVVPGQDVDSSTAPVGFVTPGRGDAKTIAMAAAGVAVVAAVAAAITGPSAWYWSLFQTLYQVALHTATGVVGVVIAATLSERPLGDTLLAWARMALAVAALRLCVAINLPLTQTKLEEVLIGITVYLGVTLVLFRRPPVELFFLWATHAALWLITYIGAWIDVEAATAIVPPK